MRMYVRATYAAAIAIFRTGCSDEAEERMRQIYEHNANVSSAVHRLIMHGGSVYQKSHHGKRLDIFHQSTRKAKTIQISHFAMLGNTWVALSHSEASSPEELKKHLVTGTYINMRGEVNGQDKAD